jgi:hypothetical protein
MADSLVCIIEDEQLKLKQLGPSFDFSIVGIKVFVMNIVSGARCKLPLLVSL